MRERTNIRTVPRASQRSCLVCMPASELPCVRNRFPERPGRRSPRGWRAATNRNREYRVRLSSFVPFRSGVTCGFVFFYDRRARHEGRRWGPVWRRRLGIIGSNFALHLLHFLVIVGLYDFADDRAGGFAAVQAAAFLNEYRYHDLRVSSGCITNEPTVVIKLFLLAEFCAGVVADNLRGAGFAAQFHVLDLERCAGPTRFIHYAIHSFGNFLDSRLRKWDSLLANILKIFPQMRLLEDATGSDSPN